MRTHPGRLTGWRAALVWLVVGLELTLTAARYVAIPLGANMPVGAAGVVVAILFVGMVASLGVVGALVVTRQPRNPVGWILWVASCLVALSIVSEIAIYRASIDPVIPPWAVLLTWFGGILFVPAIGMVIVFVPLLFPDGRLLSPRWRWLVAFSVVSLVVIALPLMFTPGPLSNSAIITNPIGIPGFDQLVPLLGVATELMLVIAFPLAISAAVIRYRRGTSVERQQLKWFAAAVVVTGIGFLAAFVPVEPIASLGWVVGLVGLLTLPVAIGMAILRYRLYDIDRIISRTIGYLIVTGMLVVVFVGAVLVSRAILGQFLGENPVGVAASTLIVAALFQPLRRRVQRVADRKFDRARYNGQRTTEAFAERLRDQVDLGDVMADLTSTATGALRPTAIMLWIRGPEGGR